MSALTVDIKPPSIEGVVITVNTPGTLSQLLADYDTSTIKELVVIGSLNDTDIAILKSLPNLEVLDMENTSVTALPKNAFLSKKSLKSIRLPRLLKTLGDDSFNGCSNLTNVEILSNITTFGSYAFGYCENLKSPIVIPENVVDLKTLAFYHCSGELFVYCNIPSADSADSAWFRANNFTKIVVGDNVTFLGKYCFYGCQTSIENITIGCNVKSIGDYAIPNYTKPINIYCKAQTPPKTSTSTYTGWKYCTLYVPTGCKEAYAAANGWKSAKEIIEMEF